MTWTPNDELIYTVPSEDRVIVYITEPGSLDVARTVRLPSSYAGQVKTLDASPDGSKLLMGYVPPFGVRVSGVLLLDLATLQITVPAIVESEIDIVPLGDDIKGRITAPTWSPDGEWILLTEGSGEFFGTGVATSEQMYAVPAKKPVQY